MRKGSSPQDGEELKTGGRADGCCQKKGFLPCGSTQGLSSASNPTVAPPSLRKPIHAIDP